MALLIEPDALTAGRLEAAIGGTVRVLDTSAMLKREIAGDASVDLVVFGPSVALDDALQFTVAHRVDLPSLGVILVRDRVTSAILRDAMRAGTREVLQSDELTLLQEACARSRDISAGIRGREGDSTPSLGKSGSLITVFAAKGGAGKTTFATNIAAALAGNGKRRVCVVDLDLAFGDVAIALQLFPTRTLADAVGLSRLDESAITSLITPHSPGLDAIAAPIDPGTSENIPVGLVSDLLALLKNMYQVVVVDTPPAFTEQVLAAFDLSDHFVLPATLDIPSVKNLKLTLETLDLLSYPRDLRHVVLNRSDAKVGLSVEDVEKTLGTSISARVPSSRAVPTSINRGVPIVLDSPTHPVSLAIRSFAESQLLAKGRVEGPLSKDRRLSWRKRRETTT